MAFAGHNQGKHWQPGVGYVRGKQARVLLEEAAHVLKCPYCQSTTSSMSLSRKCSGCGRRWFQKRNAVIYIFVE